MKPWFASKTLWTAFLTLLASIGAAAQGEQEWAKTWKDIAPFVMAAAMVALRFITKSPIE